MVPRRSDMEHPMKNVLLALALFSSQAFAAPTMSVIYTDVQDVAEYEDVLVKDSIVCSDKAAVINFTRLAGNNNTLEFKAVVTGYIQAGRCIVADEDFDVVVDGIHPVSTQNGLLFAVRLVSGGHEFWTSANYMNLSREMTIKWTAQLTGR